MLQKGMQILVKGKDKTDSIRNISKSSDRIDITYSNGKTYSYRPENVRFIASALSNETSRNIFEYLKKIAWTVGLKDSNGNNILANRYEKIDFVSEESMLAAVLSGHLHIFAQPTAPITIYPFGFNLSQKVAIENALTHSLSIIEGPPGTGKTQTILNIIANAVMRGESVAVVSGNNSATGNILEKLEQHQVGFIAAFLGNSDNKRLFVESQRPLPELSQWRLSSEQKQTKIQCLHRAHIAIADMLEKKNELSALQVEVATIETEQKHFLQYAGSNTVILTSKKLAKVTTSQDALEMWLLCEFYGETERKGKGLITFVKHILEILGRTGRRKKTIRKLLESNTMEDLIAVFQRKFYELRMFELSHRISELRLVLDGFNFNDKMQEYTTWSFELFKDKLAEKYKSGNRQQFSMEDLWKHAEDFIAAYPVILSTTYSLRSSLSSKVMYDYVIVDEASQVDLATGALALSCAKKAVIVGDLKQLPNVVNSKDAQKTDTVFAEFDLPEIYRYKNHSLLLAVSELFVDTPRILLREHYRCHPIIIGFCNQKFYDNQLIILTEAQSDRNPLVVYKTAPGNHAREHVNQRQIDVIKSEIIPQQDIDQSLSVGIVTPYRNQTNALQNAFAGSGIQADTVDKFQGRENDVIILSPVDNEIAEFTDDANRLNVAVSRAIKQLIVVVNGGNENRDTNIADLVRYAEYNNLEIIQSEVYSVFDYLYTSYREARNLLLQKQKRISDYDSENLMYSLICDVLKSDERFHSFDVEFNYQLRMIVRDMDRLDEREKQYLQNPWTHVDFLVCDRFGKTPKLVIEVDGASFHAEGTRQAERDKLKNTILNKYKLPYVRFKTTDSGERERLIAALNGVLLV